MKKSQIHNKSRVVKTIIIINYVSLCQKGKNATMKFPLNTNVPNTAWLWNASRHVDLEQGMAPAIGFLKTGKVN